MKIYKFITDKRQAMFCAVSVQVKYFNSDQHLTEKTKQKNNNSPHTLLSYLSNGKKNKINAKLALSVVVQSQQSSPNHILILLELLLSI